MGSDIARVNNITVKKGDIVEIKFKKIEDILTLYRDGGWRANDVFNTLSLENHMVTIVKGGFFQVNDVSNEDNDYCLLEINRRTRVAGTVRPNEITITDHNSDINEFIINEHIIESIEVREDVGEYYFSDKFQLSLLKIDGLLIINGVPLNKDDKELINILEKTIADLSIRSMLEESDEKEEEF